MTDIPNYRAIIRKENIVTLIVNGIGAFFTFFYLNVIAPSPSAGHVTTPIAKTSLYLFIFVGVFTVSLGMYLGHRMEKRVRTWYMLIESGQKTPAEVPAEVKRDVLNYPIYATSISTTMWILVDFFFAFTNQSIQMLIGIVFGGGLLVTVLLYFISDLFWRPMIPFFFPDGHLSAVRAFRLPVLGKLLIAFLFIGILPPAFLVSVSWERAQQLLDAPNPATVLANLRLLQIFILVIGIIFSIWLAIFTTRSITDPIHALRKAMGEVQNNNLETRVLVSTNDELGYLGEHFNQMTAGLRQKEKMRNLLNLYLSPEVAQEALARGTELGGKLIECTVLFADIRDFTSISESLPPQDLMTLLNRYMSMMVEVIVAHGGMVNKFGGDSLLAVFGTPLNPAENHAAQAVRSAQAMLHALASFNRTENRFAPLRIGIGIATGKVIAGNIGGQERLEYTVIGDTVNLAARLEDKTKEIDGNVLISAESYRQAARHIDIQARFLPQIHVKGKREAVGVYALDL